MWRSTLVSPLVMSMACHRVSPPRATATELRDRRRVTTSTSEASPAGLDLRGWGRGGAHLVRTQRKMMHLWAVVSVKGLVSGGVW